MILDLTRFEKHDYSVMDDLDFQLVNALQISPRISWAQLGGVLHVDPSTLSRRWRRLVDEGVVWTSCSFRPQLSRLTPSQMMAIVEVGCTPGHREAVIQRLTEESPVASIHCTTGPRDLYLTVGARTLQEIDRYVDEQVARVPGISSIQTHLIRTLFQEGSSWRVPALTSSQMRAVGATLPLRQPPKAPTEDHLQIIRALEDDVRRPVSELHETLGKSLSSVSRGIEGLLNADWVRWRVDFSFTEKGWTCGAMLWMSVNQSQIQKVSAAMRVLPQVRMCASVTGEANLVVSTWLRAIEDLDEIENRLASFFEDVQIRDRWIIPRIAKIQGHVLDKSGRHSRYVPTNGGDDA
jgi:DNA-binding Lrp family transcriptional regulator